MKKKRGEADSLKKLEQLLQEDVKRSRSKKERFREEWRRLAVRMGAYVLMITLFRIIGILADLRQTLIILAFFVIVEFFRFIRFDLLYKRLLKRK